MASYSFYYNGNDYTVYYYDYSRGGGVFVDDGHFEMSGGLITENTIEEPEIVLTEQQQQEQEHQEITLGMGGGVFASSFAYINMTGGEIKDNSSSIAPGIIVSSQDEGGKTEFFMAGSSYIDDIYLVCMVGGMNEFENGDIYIQLAGPLTTKKQMNVTCASIVRKNYSYLKDNPTISDNFYLLDGWDKQVVMDAISKFKIINEGYKIVLKENNDYGQKYYYGLVEEQ